MSGRLPREIDPIRLADEEVRLAGDLPLSEFPRLRDFACAGAGSEPVAIELVFERTAQGVRLMRGRIQARVPMICQRCLEPVVLGLEAKPFAELLRPGDAPAGLADDPDALVVDGARSLRELVEDELLLVMPMVPMHDEGECKAPGAANTVAPVSEKKPNPFATLRAGRGKDQQT